MKAISSFVATILLIGFTVAVGAIISAFFMTYTRTTTAGVSSATACASGMLDVSVTHIDQTNQNYTIVLIKNRGTTSITITSLSVICGNSQNTTTSLNIQLTPGNQTTQGVYIPGSSKPCNTDYSNIQVSVVGNCAGGGTLVGGCSQVGCKLY